MKVMKKFYVDRLEEKIVVCVDEKGKLFEFNIDNIVGKVGEGSVLVKKNKNLVVDEFETDLKREENSKLQDELFDNEKNNTFKAE